MDETRSLFEAAEERVLVPPADLGAVVRRGRARRRCRMATGVVSALVVAVAGGAAAAILGGQDSRPVPVTPPDVHRPSERLVPVVMEGPTPFRELASADELADARAITVAFHAFLEGTGRRYNFDYEGFDDFEDKWRVRFAQFPPPSREEYRLRRLQRVVESQAERLRAERAELGAAARALREEKEARRARRLLAELRDARRDMKRMIRRQGREMAALQERRQRLLGHPRPYVTELTIVEQEGTLVVEDVNTDSPEATSLSDAIGYSEPVAEVDAWGADYFDATFRRRAGPTDDVAVEVFGFWTGPLYSAYEETCRPQVVTRAGKVVWTERRIDAPPGARGLYQGAPEREETRDNLLVRFEIDYRGHVGGLSLRMLCAWRPRQ